MGFFSSIAHGISAALPIIGGVSKEESAKQASAQEYARQKEFAKNGLRWRVEDAKAAGIHPIFAVGANTPTYSPQAAVGSDMGLSSIGQDIGRAIEAGQTHKERQEMASVQKAYYEAQIANVQAQTKQHEAQTDAIRQGIINDALYNNADFITQSALASQSRTRSQQSTVPFPESNPYNDSPVPTYGFQYDSKGRRTALVPSDALAQRYEDKFILEWLPFIGAAFENLKGKFFGQPVGGGYYWHGDDKGYLPFAPKKRKSSSHAQPNYFRNPYRE